MMRAFLPLLLMIPAIGLRAQDIRFNPDPQAAERAYATEVPRLFGHCTDSLRSDTVYTEDLASGALEMQVQNYPFARYEYHVDGSLYRRIDIVQVEDTREVGWKRDLATGDTIGMLEMVVQDIPKGAYHEFFPNGNIRIMGRLDGFNNYGTVKKVGEWREWDEEGKVIRREEYPE
ncbi:MAG TPA: hypothetical protein VGE21_16300 [Flavobacteriales bacterium]